MDIGDEYATNSSGIIKILEYRNSNSVTILFKETGFIKTTRTESIHKGSVRDPYAKTFLGVGFIGEGPFKITKGEIKAGQVWRDMLGRCYYEDDCRYSRYGGRGVHVCEHWHNFQNFAEWFTQKYRKGTVLDKDLRKVGSKIYSPETCECVPVDINSLFLSCVGKRGKYPVGVSLHKESGKFRAYGYKKVLGKNKKIHLGSYATPQEAHEVYKKFKMEHIREIAMKYLFRGEISKEIYNNLIHWKIIPFPV